MKRLTRKMSLFLIAVLTFIGIAGQTVLAATNSQSVNISYKVFASGSGIVSGKTTGVWHYFAKSRTVSLVVKSKSGAGTTYSHLYRSVVGFDKSYGEVHPTVGTHKFGTKTDATSGSYYLEFYGGNANTTQKVSGSIHD